MSTTEVIKLNLKLDKSSSEYVAGEAIRGTAVWEALPEKTNKLSVRLIWYTQGRGDRDVELLASLDFEITSGMHRSGQQSFDFVAPSRPYSFSGKLIELTWAVELIAYPTRDSVVEKLVIGPNGKMTELSRSHEAPKRSFFSSNNRS